ncbi:hypothetical protein SKAU_G00314580 [Synaphobranchus kaupii]|uniref:Uncharacterized protein n=1 Tax=Synaphobranchus kaupii TaxID=118154 RepID=A0A9Q1ESJ0_SYNKA|nr:hypothetical protein SKAU_G00314580 [Synaphobranchus kaupii]
MARADRVTLFLFKLEPRPKAPFPAPERSPFGFDRAFKSAAAAATQAVSIEGSSSVEPRTGSGRRPVKLLDGGIGGTPSSSSPQQ